jgi:Leucine-rich repeat (LRR) protein
MKNIYLLFICLSSTLLSAQNIPDANFAAAIRSICPTCIDASNNLLSPAQNLTTLDVSNKSIANLTGINGFTGLKELNCSRNSLTILPSLPSGLLRLYCIGNYLTSLPTLPTTVYEFNCSYNLLTNLPALHNGLKDVTCSFNQLTSFPLLPSSMIYFGIPGNLLTSIPNLPVGLSYLECSENNISSLPSLPSTLTTLSCGKNNLTTLPNVDNLYFLFCDNNKLTTIPNLINLVNLRCNNNKLTSLPALPNSLILLTCSNNLLTSLPTLPNRLQELECYGNQLTSLPSVPVSLTKLTCGRNSLTSIPSSVYYTELTCEDNYIQCLPTLGNSLTKLWIPNTVTCLPNIPTSLTNFRKYTGAYGSGVYSSTILPICTGNTCSAPTITQCPTNINITTNSADCNATLPNMLTGFQATTNCATTGLTYSQLPVAGTILSGHGTIQTVVFKVIDNCGLSATCSATVTLEDKRAPEIIVRNITTTLLSPSAQSSITLNDVVNRITDNCTPTNQIQTVLSKSTFTCADVSASPVQVRVTATDLAGNSNYAIANVTVSDNANLCSLIGAGFNNSCLTIVSDANGNIYAGGDFTTAGGITVNHVAKWNGTNWSALGTGLGSGGGCSALTFDTQGNLYAGGTFTFATSGGITVNNIAKWNGVSWSALGTGLNGDCYALSIKNGILYAGGNFDIAGGVSASYVAQWNGSNWATVGSGLNERCFALANDNSGNLYAGGYFTNAGGTVANQIAKWNGTSWATLGTGLSGVGSNLIGCYGLAWSNNTLYAGGNFTFAGGNSANRVASWNGSTWSNMGSGFNNPTNVFAFDANNNVYAGGSFATSGGSTVKSIGKWNGSSWTQVAGGLTNRCDALLIKNNIMYAGGLFPITSSGQYFTQLNLSIIPVELLSFKAQNTEGGNLLTWQTASEVNTAHFDIERSNDGIKFDKIGNTKARSKAATYEFIDKTSARFVTSPTLGATYYRLKINDLDGTSSYSNIVSVATKGKGLTAKVFPNPFGDNINVDISTEKKTDVTVDVIDVLGRSMRHFTFYTEGSLNLPISTKDWPSGTYFLKISDGQTVVQQKIIRQ